MSRYKTITVNTTDLPTKWVDAVMRQFQKNRRMFVEASLPEREHYPELSRWKWRLTQARPDFVCAELTEAKYDFLTDELSFKCEYVGPFSAFVSKRVLQPRCYVDDKGNTVPVIAFEFGERIK